MKNIVIATLICSILGLAMIGGALYWQPKQTSDGKNADALPADHSYTLKELARYNGEDGNKCLVAVDGKVYLIEGFYLWKNGEHTPSGGRVDCGRDLTEVIDESPHGRSKLQLLEKVGTIEQEAPTR